MKKVLVIILTFVGINLMAQTRPDSYNYQRGLEAVQNEKTEEALEYFNKDVSENPKNGYSYSWIAMLRNHLEEYGKALTAVELAIKYLPKKDAEYTLFAYATRADIYLNLEDTIKALADYATAIKIKPEESSMYEKRAQIYYEQEKYDLADADYQKMIELKPGETMGYMGKATDDIISAMSLDWDRKALYLADELQEPAFTMLVSKLKVQAAKSPNEATWPYIIGGMYEEKEQYEKAIDYYHSANALDATASVYQRIAICQYEMGNYDEALSSIDHAIDMDSTVLSYMAYKANILYEMGNVQSAIKEWTRLLTTKPEYGYGYYRRGWFKQIAGDLDGAVDDLSMAVVLDPDYSYSYVSRGEIYKKQGKIELAEADFKKVIEIEDSPEKYECVHYAYHGLGEDKKAIAAIDSIIARDSTDTGSYYDAACLYSRMQDKENALKCLAKSLELGYNRFAHIDQDFDMDFLRNMDEFKELVGRYRSAHMKRSGQDRQTLNKRENDNTVMTEIPFVKEDGICKVKCDINGLPLHFVFDTGASDVTLSMVEATFMMKNGYLSGNDVIGSQRYMDANGDINVGTVINLKKVSFGDLELKNVRASVVRSQKAPLLLGQSVLGRLGKIEIDNSGRVIKIIHQKDF